MELRDYDKAFYRRVFKEIAVQMMIINERSDGFLMGISNTQQ